MKRIKIDGNISNVLIDAEQKLSCMYLVQSSIVLDDNRFGWELFNLDEDVYSSIST